MNRRRWTRAILLTIMAALVVTGTSQAGGKKEEQIGREYAAQVEKTSVLVDDPAVVERVKHIGDTIAAIAKANVVPAGYGSSDLAAFEYHFKVIQDKDVNAFALPGGYIYVNTGLLDIIKSDDELAGVLAHEIAHVAHHHTTQLLRAQAKADRYVALAALAGILGNMRSRDLNNLLLGAQMIKTGKINGYSVTAEKDADKTAVQYLVKSSYNPEGLLTLMNKLEAQRVENPTLPLGIFQTHPAPFRRASAVIRAMRENGMDIDIRKIRNIAFAKPVPVAEGSSQYQVVIGQKVICAPADMKSGPTSQERAQLIADRVNTALKSKYRTEDIREDPSHVRLLVNGAEIFKVESEDTAGGAENNQALLHRARSGLAYAAWADWLCNQCLDAWDETSD